jgi:hypothetical protein
MSPVNFPHHALTIAIMVLLAHSRRDQLGLR